MKEVAIFNGTIEGSILCKKLCERKVSVTAFISNEYGDVVLEPVQYLTIVKEQVSFEDIVMMLQKFDVVIDATNSEAVEIKCNIKNACKTAGVPYLCVKKQNIFNEIGMNMESMQDVVTYLAFHTGNVLLMSGCTEIEYFSALPNFKERIKMLISPNVDSLHACNSAGFVEKQIIAFDGTYSISFYHALLREMSVKYVVMKNADDKKDLSNIAEAVKMTGATLIIVKNSEANNIDTIDQTIKLTMQFLGSSY